MTRDAKHLTPEQLRVVAWLAAPEKSREPKTLPELADEIGVKVATIYRWRERLNLDEWASDEARKGLFLHLPEVYKVLAERAKSGSYPHMKLFLETTGGYAVSGDVSAR
jgi:hypothetical protein